MRPDGPYWIEGFSYGGSPQHVKEIGGAEFPADPPPGSRSIKLRMGRGIPTVMPLRKVRSPRSLKKVVPEPIGEGATLRFPVFSERFDDEEEFYKRVQELYDWIKQVPPFDCNKFGMNAYFWPLGKSESHFNTNNRAPDSCTPGGPAQTYHGDNPTAKRKLTKFMIDGKLGLVLINSKVRGGAGGIPEHGFPAWASLGSCGEDDKWQAIALHEIGHALGLADEYLDSRLAREERKDEPNCSVSSEAEAAPWYDPFLKEAEANLLWSCEDQNDPEKMRGIDDSFVGLFQGARYRRGYYRPSLNCLMRDIAFPRFCPVCVASIGTQLGIGGSHQ